MSLTRQINKNNLIQLIGKTVFGINVLFVLSFLTRYLGEEGYGAYATIFTWMVVLSIIADMGLYQTGVRELSRTGADKSRILGNLISLKLLCGFGSIVLALLVLMMMPYGFVVWVGILIVMISMLAKTVTDAYKSIFQVELQMQYPAMGEALGSCLTLLLTYIVLRQGHGVIATIIALVIGAVLHLCISIWFAHRLIHVRLRFDLPIVKALSKGALPLGLSGIMAIAYFHFDLLMLSWMKTLEEVGIYGAAYKIVELSSIVPAVFLGTVFPLFTRAIEMGNGKLSQLYHQAFFYLTNISIPVLIGGLVLAAPLMQLIAGDQFAITRPFDLRICGISMEYDPMPFTFRILLFSMALMFLGQLNGHLIIAAGRQIKLLRIYFILVPANILLNLYLIPRFSFIGAAVSTLITEVGALTYTTWVVVCELRQKPIPRILIQAFAASIPMAGVVWYLERIDVHVVISIGIGAFCYGLMLFGMGGFRDGYQNVLKEIV